MYIDRMNIYIAVGGILFIILLGVIISWYVSTPPVNEFVVEVRLVFAHGHALSSDQVVTETVKDPKKTLKTTLDRLCNTAPNPNPPGMVSGPEINVNLFKFEIRHVTSKHSKYALQFAVRNPNAMGTKSVHVEYDTFRLFSYNPDHIWDVEPQVV
jgi:hypothetical protein